MGRTANQANIEARKRQILVAAMQCFGKIGLQKTTIHDISKACGMRAGHIAYYFKSKDDIVEAAYLLGTEDLLSRIDHELDEADIVDAIIGIHRKSEIARRDWNLTPALRMEFVAETVRNPRLLEIQRELVEQTLLAQKRVAERAAAAGRLKPGFDAEDFARAVTLLWSGLSTVRASTEEDIIAYEQVAAKLLEPLLTDDRVS